MHAHLTIGSSKLFVSDVNAETGSKVPTPSKFHFYMPDVEATFKRAT